MKLDENTYNTLVSGVKMGMTTRALSKALGVPYANLNPIIRTIKALHEPFPAATQLMLAHKIVTRLLVEETKDSADA